MIVETILKIFFDNWANISLLCLVMYLIRIAFLVGTFTTIRRSLKEKIIIVTGASAGIGKSIAQQLLEDGAIVIYACRDKEKTMKAWKQIEKTNKELLKRAHFIELNLISFKSVQNFVEEFNRKFPKLDILINNAALFPIKFEMTDDGLESIYQQNFFSSAYLTLLLLDRFDKTEGRILNASSFAHVQCDFSVENIEKMKKDRECKAINDNYYGNVWIRHYHYSNTKTAFMLFTCYLSEYLEKNHPHIKAVMPNPGLVYTEFARFMYGNKFLGVIYDLFFFMYIYIAKTAISGAQTALHVCYEDFNAIPNGAYYSDCKIGKMSTIARDKEIRDAMVKYTFEVFGEKDLLKYVKILPFVK